MPEQTTLIRYNSLINAIFDSVKEESKRKEEIKKFVNNGILSNEGYRVIMKNFDNLQKEYNDKNN